MKGKQSTAIVLAKQKGKLPVSSSQYTWETGIIGTQETTKMLTQYGC